MKSISLCGKLSLLLGIGSILLGVYLLYKEIAANTFIIHQSIAVAFICMGIFFLFHFSLKALDEKSGQSPSCNIQKRS